jgi:hypothetical protein
LHRVYIPVCSFTVHMLDLFMYEFPSDITLPTLKLLNNLEPFCKFSVILSFLKEVCVLFIIRSSKTQMCP